MRNNRIVHKILHIIESFDRGAVGGMATRNGKRKQQVISPFRVAFFSILPTTGTKDELAKGEGCLIHRSTVGLGKPF